MSETDREIDIVLRDPKKEKGLIAFDCKDHKRPIDLKEIESTIGILQDINAAVGIVVSASGFTKAALKRGEKAGLKLYKLLDTGDHQWKTHVSFPAVCQVRNLSNFQFHEVFHSSEPVYLEDSLILYDKNKSPLGTEADLLLNHWFDG